MFREVDRLHQEWNSEEVGIFFFRDSRTRQASFIFSGKGVIGSMLDTFTYEALIKEPYLLSPNLAKNVMDAITHLVKIETATTAKDFNPLLDLIFTPPPPTTTFAPDFGMPYGLDLGMGMPSSLLSSLSAFDSRPLSQPQPQQPQQQQPQPQPQPAAQESPAEISSLFPQPPASTSPPPSSYAAEHKATVPSKSVPRSPSPLGTQAATPQRKTVGVNATVKTTIAPKPTPSTKLLPTVKTAPQTTPTATVKTQPEKATPQEVEQEKQVGKPGGLEVHPPPPKIEAKKAEPAADTKPQQASGLEIAAPAAPQPASTKKEEETAISLEAPAVSASASSGSSSSGGDITLDIPPPLAPPQEKAPSLHKRRSSFSPGAARKDDIPPPLGAPPAITVSHTRSRSRSKSPARKPAAAADDIPPPLGVPKVSLTVDVPPPPPKSDASDIPPPLGAPKTDAADVPPPLGVPKTDAADVPPPLGVPKVASDDDMPPPLGNVRSGGGSKTLHSRSASMESDKDDEYVVEEDDEDEDDDGADAPPPLGKLEEIGREISGFINMKCASPTPSAGGGAPGTSPGTSATLTTSSSSPSPSGSPSGVRRLEPIRSMAATQGSIGNSLMSIGHQKRGNKSKSWSIFKAKGGKAECTELAKPPDAIARGDSRLLSQFIRESKDTDFWSMRPFPSESWVPLTGGLDAACNVDGACIKSGFNIEYSAECHTKKYSETGHSILQGEEEYYFYEEFVAGAAHDNYLVPEVPAIVSIQGKEAAAGSVTGWCKAIIRTKDADRRLYVPFDRALKAVKAAYMASVPPSLAGKEPKFIKIKDAELESDLREYEHKQVPAKRYKFGVLYVRPGQTEENDMFGNKHAEASADYLQFLQFIGEEIELKGFSKYRAGLDVTCDTTGTRSVYRGYKGYEIMYHVATLLPDQAIDEQKVEKKRHIGNDVVVLIFKDQKDENDKFNPAVLTSHFNHCFFVFTVAKRGEDGKATHYRLNVAYKSGVPPCQPYINDGGVFPMDENFIDLLMAKLINSERSAYASPEFSSLKTSRKIYLSTLCKKYTE